MAEIADLIDELAAATSRLIASVEQIADAPDALTEPSGLPSWTRAHVLVHLSRNSDGLRNLLLAARSGELVRMYASLETRRADINVGVLRPSTVIIDDLVASASRFVVDARSMSAEAWEAVITHTSGAPNPISVLGQRIAEIRLEEVEVHHVDLDLGYRFSDTPPSVAKRLIHAFAVRRANQGVDLEFEIEGETERVLAGRAESPVVIGDSAPVILNWLAGRAGERLPRVVGSRELPELPTFG